MAKILVIDDDQGIRRLLDSLLRRKGYDVVLAENGRRGLELFRREHPDVIVLDLKMPEMDGLTVLRQIRSVDLKQSVIIFTGAGTPETEQQIRALGVTEIVEKDVSLDRLEDSLKRLLNPPDSVAGEGDRRMTDAEDPNIPIIGTGQYLKRPAMLTWSTKKPKAPGFYWYRKSHGLKVHIVEVELDGVTLRVDDKNSDQCRGEVATIEGQWAGPLLPPE
jgi:DNA-binding NtrC family response regulator